ncbi:protein of unknown function (plasmid) [Cupriavidus neocaledonicus]|uniref:Uncharacterized protein n=1 Tax=Cupriavidus neocaledonicus TaxID=1040979 RepID=A0A375HU87_9BURK|nr:hypothetical protein CBM2605_B40010 [Cupriavidus neocaledonicus]SPD60993.1 protein of unknown function [Cupriavidus neocaledonicus]
MSKCEGELPVILLKNQDGRDASVLQYGERGSIFESLFNELEPLGRYFPDRLSYIKNTEFATRSEWIVVSFYLYGFAGTIDRASEELFLRPNPLRFWIRVYLEKINIQCDPLFTSFFCHGDLNESGLLVESDLKGF